MQKIQGFEDFFKENIETTEVLCPVCLKNGKRNYLVKYKEVEDGPREGMNISPVCLVCNYISNNKRDAESVNDRIEKGIAVRNKNMFKHGSLVADKKLFSKTLVGYEVSNEETDKALKLAYRTCKKVLNKEVAKCLLVGNPGAGKSHLSMAILNEINEKSSYQVGTMFINYRELFTQLKNTISLSDEFAKKKILQQIMPDLKKVDVLVIDDLGSELGNLVNVKEATAFNVETLTSILDARLSKSTIFTTNLTSKQLKQAYSERVASRILADMGMKEDIVVFKETRDRRQKA